MSVHPIEVRAVDDQKIFILFGDGVSGEIDLSHLHGKGIFKKWDTTTPFKNVFINPENHSIAWDEELEIDSENLYFKLIGMSFEDWQKLQEEEHAAN